MMNIVTITSSNIADLRSIYDASAAPLQQFEKTVSQPWIDHTRPYAYALEKDGRFVGSIQSIYAKCPIAGQDRLICNLSTWYVEEEHRSSSMRLLLRAIADAGDTPLTALTPSGLAADIYRRLRFRALDEARFAMAINGGGIEALGDPDNVFLRLAPGDKRVFNDHRGLGLHHCLIQGPATSFWFSYLVRERFEFRVADLLNAGGDIDLLRSGWSPPAGSPLAACQRLLIDARFLPDMAGWGLDRADPFNPRFYKGDENLRLQLDFMYSEIPLVHPTLL